MCIRDSASRRFHATAGACQALALWRWPCAHARSPGAPPGSAWERLHKSTALTSASNPAGGAGGAKGHMASTPRNHVAPESIWSGLLLATAMNGQHVQFA
eukprot:12506709-Alexandrium_andersonii.AAC.1